MDVTILRLLSLLRHSLLGKQIDISLFASMTNEDWEKLYNVSQKQEVVAFAFEALKDMDLKPAKALLLKWISLSILIEKNYKRQERATTALADKFAESGIRTLVLKGLAISRCYPIPYYRQCGDADIFLVKGKENACEQGNKTVETLGIAVNRDYYKNSSFTFKGLHVENHRFCTQIRGSKRTKKLERILETMLFQEKTEQISDTDMEIPCAMFNALFLTEHAKNHFLREGISLRHICDWMMFRLKYADCLNWSIFENTVKEFRILQFVQSMNHVADFIMHGKDNVLDEKDKLFLNDTLSERVSTSSQEFSLAGRWILIKETVKSQWKYKIFSDVSMAQWLLQSCLGYFFDRRPKL